MNKHTITSSYRQFYVADSNLEPLAPEIWTKDDVSRRHNTDKNITALVTDGDITARLIIYGPDNPELDMGKPDFIVETEIDIETGEVGIYEWPFELLEKFKVQNGKLKITFKGYNTKAVENEEDFYTVKI